MVQLRTCHQTIGLVALACTAFLDIAAAQGIDPIEGLGANAPGHPTHEVQIRRLVYEHGVHSGWGPGRAWWRIDWPEAEAHFLGGVTRYTVIDAVWCAAPTASRRACRSDRLAGSAFATPPGA